jgi:Ohr subfamily peroxiredoxin
MMPKSARIDWTKVSETPSFNGRRVARGASCHASSSSEEVAMPQTASSQHDKVLYTARLHTIGGREHGHARSSDGRLDVQLSVPGGPGTGTNPEQLLAAGWSACFESAVAIVARKARIVLPPTFAIEMEVDLNHGADGYSLSARMTVSLPGLDRLTAEKVVEEAHGICPYSKALGGRVDLTTMVSS